MKQEECIGFYPSEWDPSICDRYNFINNMCKFFTDHECEYAIELTRPKEEK